MSYWHKEGQFAVVTVEGKYGVLNLDTEIVEHETSYLWEAVHMCKWLKIQLDKTVSPSYLKEDKAWISDPRQQEFKFPDDLIKN